MAINWHQIPADEFAESSFEVRSDTVPLFNLGFQRLSLLSHLVYITMQPLAGLARLRKSEAVALRQSFSELRGWAFFCQVAKSDRAAIRWAEFFQFSRAVDELPDRWTYVRDMT